MARIRETKLHAQWEVGQKVVCVHRVKIDPKVFEHDLIVGQIYTIREKVFSDNEWCLKLQELINPLTEHPSGKGVYEPFYVASAFCLYEEK